MLVFLDLGWGIGPLIIDIASWSGKLGPVHFEMCFDKGLPLSQKLRPWSGQ